MGGSAPSGPSHAQEQQEAQQRAALRKKQQQIDLQQVESLRRASAEGGLLAGATPVGLTPPPAKANIQVDTSPSNPRNSLTQGFL